MVELWARGFEGTAVRMSGASPEGVRSSKPRISLTVRKVQHAGSGSGSGSAVSNAPRPSGAGIGPSRRSTTGQAAWLGGVVIMPSTG